MFRIMNEYLSKVSLQVGDDIYGRIDNVLRTEKGIKKYSVNTNFNRYIIDIKLDGYSLEKAEEFYRRLSEKLSYPYSSMYLRYNEGAMVRYRFITCKEDKTGIYADIVIS